MPTPRHALASGAIQTPHLPVAHFEPATQAEGPGKRFALWLQGCPLRCPGCCNPEMLSFTGGVATKVERMLAQIINAARRQQVEGLTLLGGEPFAHAAPCAALARGVRDAGLSVMVFTGFTLEELRAADDPAVAALLGEIDILVDGPYRRELPETRRRWIGSSNQRAHFLTGRYDASDACWLQPNTLELRLQDGELRVNGFPAAGALKHLATRIKPE